MVPPIVNTVMMRPTNCSRGVAVRRTTMAIVKAMNIIISRVYTKTKSNSKF